MGASQDLIKLTDDINEFIKFFFNRRQMKSIGEEMARLIRIRTQTGKGVDSLKGNNIKSKPLPRLADSSKAIRKEARKSGLLSDLTRPNKSNLTFTGQLMKSIGVKTYSDGVVKVGPRGYRDDGLSNEEVANRLQDGVVSKQFGKRRFLFMQLTALQQKQIVRFINNDFNSVISRRFR